MRRAQLPPAVEESATPEETAREAGLRYVTDHSPGIGRRRAGTGFSYRGPAGETIRDVDTLARIKALAIPPAWSAVWICPDPRGHIQATGRDAKGRKVYRYHDRWRAVRDETKFDRMVAFGEALPSIRERTSEDLSRHGLPRERVLATVVRLLDETLIRVGNEEYARGNDSYGLTTLRGRHVDVSGQTVHFHFRGKAGQAQRVDIRDRRVARVIRRLQELPGQQMFEYMGDEGVLRGIGSEDVNAYLREVSGEDFTAKDFRTWGATVLAAHALRDLGPAATKTQRHHQSVEAVKQAARHLGNTPAVCRKSYIHPAVLEGYENGSLLDAWDESGGQGGNHRGLRADEAVVLEFLRGAARGA